jgi:MORN repeat
MKCFGVITMAAILFVPVGAMAQTQAPAPPAWITAKNKPCKIWNPEPQPNESVTWSGPCKGGYASGNGILRWTENGKPDVEFDGDYANGKRNGHGVLITPDGKRAEGQWADDEPVVVDPNAI